MNGCSLLLVNNLFSKMMRSWKIKLFEYIYLRVEIEWLYGIMNPFFFFTILLQIRSNIFFV